jgi:WD40 repeat protein
MATCGSGGAFIWDYQTGTLLHRLEAHHREVLTLRFSPSGVLLTGGGDAVVRAWDVESGAELRSFVGSIGRILDLSFAPDGQSFVAVADDKARVWSFSTGELLHTFAVPGAGIAQARFAPDSHRLVTAHISFTNTVNNVRLWDLATEQTIRSFGNSFVQRLEFVAEGKLVTGGADLVVQVWDIETGQLIRPLPGTTLAEQAIQGFLTSTNSSLVVAGCLNGRVIAWDASTGQILHDFTGERLFSLAAIPGTNQILTAHPDNLVRVKDSQVGTTLRSIAGHTAGATQGVGFSPDRRYMVSGGNEALTRLWNRTNAEQVRVFPGFAGGTQVASFSPDGTQILTTFGASTRLLNAETGAIEREFPGSSPVFSPDGQRIATGSQDGTARLWDVATGTQIRAFSSPGSLITALAVSSDGMTLASGASDGVARLWDTSDGQLLRSFQVNAGTVSSLQFSLATGELLVAWANGVLRTFDPATGALKLGSLAPAGFVGDAVFSPDGRFILDAEGFPSFSARLWDARTGEELRAFAGHAAEVDSVAFDSTGTCILTGSDIVRLWSIADIAARLESERTPNSLELRWHVGTLQQSVNAGGPWLDLTNAVSPWLVPINQPSSFFRTKAQLE